MTHAKGLDRGGCGCDPQSSTAPLVSIDDALARIALAVAPVCESERLPLSAALGRVLSEPVMARSDMPRFDHAAMDGYAVATVGLVGAGPWRLRVAQRCTAGEARKAPLAAECAARIFTGAPLPQGADAVVLQEDAVRENGSIRLQLRPLPRDNVRFRGEELRSGDLLVPAGRRLNVRGVAAAAAGGAGEVGVRRRVRVALLVTGCELVRPGSRALGDAEIWDVNTPMLQAVLARPDVELLEVRTVGDTLGGIRAAIARGALEADLVVTTGGVSAGEEDHLLAAIACLQGTIHFAGVAMKPGKPVACGRVGDATWLGLPGNPLAAFVAWWLFGEAILDRLSDMSRGEPRRRNVVLGHDLRRKPGRCEIRPASCRALDGMGREIVDCDRAVRSGQVAALVAADGLVLLPADADHMPAGALVGFVPFCAQ